GAIYSSAYVRLTGVTLSNNTAGGGGAFYAGYGSTAYFDRVLASENTALGGGTLMSAGYVSVLNSKFERNWATEGVGGAIAGTADLNVRNSVFLANSAKTKGGAIYYRSRDFLNPLYRLSVVHSVFTNNESTNGSGGAVSMNPGSVHDSLFENNAAVAAYGGALEGVSAIVNRSVFRNNSALSGGALQIYGTDVFSSAVYGNSASERGGAIHSSGGVRILNSTIDSNYAGVLGSAIAHELESLQIKNCTISDNGDGSSPAVWASVFASAWIGHTAIKGAGPRCDFDGGIVSAGYNVEDGASCGLTTGSDRQNTTVALGALAGNDGPTVGSPYFSYTATLPSRLPLGVRNALVDRGADFANQTDDLGSDGCLKLDVRGLARPEGRACDIGAVELEGLVSEPSPSSGT
ncbi:MAG TPA: choice-of-anchor Q domain-containing protein, partial [Oligoflexia bacterium]|nr:choice-of-anchor Q domain-containing protein [Oligoflexia bacterium]